MMTALKRARSKSLPEQCSKDTSARNFKLSVSCDDPCTDGKESINAVNARERS